MKYIRFIVPLLIVVAVLGVFSSCAHATTDVVFVGGVEMRDQSYLPVGGTVTQAECPSGGYAYYCDGILTLNNFVYEGTGLFDTEYEDYTGIYRAGALTVRVIGDNLIDVTGAGDSLSYGVMADSLVIEGGPYDCLTLWGTYTGIYTTGSDPLTTIKGCTVYAYGDAWGAVADISIHEGAMILSNGDYYDEIYEGDTSYGAMYGVLTLGEGLYAYGSEDPEGTALSTYAEADQASYDYISVEGKSIYVAGVEMINRSYLSVGEQELRFDEPEGGYAFYANGSLRLCNFSYEGQGHYDSDWDDHVGISAEIPLAVDVEGENSLVITTEGDKLSYGLVASQLVINGESDSSLLLSGNYAGINTTSDTPTVRIEGGNITSVGDCWGAIADITVNGGTLVLRNRDANEELYYQNLSYSALYGTLEGASSMELLGSEDPAGKDPVPYTEADWNLYDYISVAPKAVAPVVDSTIRFNHSLELAKDISINFAIAKSLLAEYDPDSVFVECTIREYEGNEPIGTTVSVLTPVLRGSYYYFAFTGLNAVQMNDLVTARFFGTKEGVAYCSAEDVYSVATYSYTQLNKTTSSQKLKELCANLLRYGSMAQAYKSYRTDAPVDGAMTEEQKSCLRNLNEVAFGNHNSVVSDLDAPSVTWVGKTLILDTKVTVKYIFSTGKYTGDLSDLRLVVSYLDQDGQNVTVSVEDMQTYDAANQRYAFCFNDLYASELRTVLSAQIYAGDQAVSDILIYSPDTYGNNKTGTLGSLCKALFAYSDVAKEFFAG